MDIRLNLGLFKGAPRSSVGRDSPKFKRDLNILKIFLRALVGANREILRYERFPPIYRSGVRYRRESFGREDWQVIPEILKKGYGDCEDLAAWRAAEVPGAVVDIITQRKPSGGYLFHIVVRHPDGTIEDPSKILGMKGSG